MSGDLTFSIYLFDHIFAQELSLLGDVPTDLRREWNEVVTTYRRDCINSVKGLQDPARQAQSCLDCLEDLPYDFDRFMLKVFDKDEKLGLQMYRENWSEMKRGYTTLTLYLAFCANRER